MTELAQARLQKFGGLLCASPLLAAPYPPSMAKPLARPPVERATEAPVVSPHQHSSEARAGLFGHPLLLHDNPPFCFSIAAK